MTFNEWWKSIGSQRTDYEEGRARAAWDFAFHQGKAEGIRIAKDQLGELLTKLRPNLSESPR